MRCKWLLPHRWDKWGVTERYIDISWGGEMPSVTMARECARCGWFQTKNRYGVDI